MENETENLDSLNEETTNQETENVDALKIEKKELSDKNRQLYERAKKAETELKELREFKSKAEAKPESQPTAPDYGKLAFFEYKGIKHPDDVKVVEDEAIRLKLPYTDILGMTHIQTRLQANREERTAKEGLPAGTTGTGASSKGTVEYYLQQGGIPMTPDGNIDQELAEKVIEARVKKETNANQFAPIH